MDKGEGEGYKPEAAFEEDTREQLFDLSLTNSTELWLIQWPFNEVSFGSSYFVRFYLVVILQSYLYFQVPDFNGKEISLNLHHDGCLGSFEASVGKTYDVVSSAVQEPDATVFVSSSSKTKIVGKISRRVSLVHYPDPEELEKQQTEKKSKRLFHKSGGSSLVNSSYHSVTPTQSTKLRSSNLSRGATLSHSSRHKSSLSEAGDDSAALKRRRIHKHNASTDRSTLDSGRGQSIYTISGLSDIHAEEN
ncbi:hypothetical protein K2173_015229 [Erythroxylum novogranatense]|uniref:Mediator-associated protein 2 n=1 Tax=Erythroxylum novogranatense TaxID=1862640 RepID=A0AAV8T1L4_9ROSI|nr:hypothetical protein K2173_015229 [Erythroxylum novogranatense]